MNTARRQGITLVELIIVMAIILLLIALAIPAIQKIRASADSLACRSQLRQLGVALHHYHKDYGSFPAGCSVFKGKDPMPYASWCTRLLPYIERDDLWREAIEAYSKSPIFYKIPPHNVATKVVNLFLCPAFANDQSQNPNIWQAVTCYLGVEGVDQDKREGVLFLDSAIRFGDVRDGTTHTLIVGERPPSADRVLGWWYAGWGQDKTGSMDMVLSVRERNTGQYLPGPVGPYHFQPGRLDDQSSAAHFWSLHPGGGANFLFVDGSVRFLRYSADPIIPALATRAGGEPVEVPD